MAQNLDLAQALARVQQARARAGAASAALAPQGELTAQAAEARQSLDGIGGTLGNAFPGFSRTGALYDLGIGASWEIDLFGGRRRGREAGFAEFEAAEASRAGTQLTVAGEVADAYLQLRGYQTRIALAEQQIKLDNQLVEIVRLRFNQGEAARRELDQAQATLTQARALTPVLRAGREAELNRLAVLTGESPEADRGLLELQSPLPTTPTPGQVGTPGDLLRRRPDLVAAERRLAAASARIGVTVADYYPKVTLQTLVGVGSEGLVGLIGASSNLAQAGAALRWRLFDFGRVDAEVAAAKGAEAEALAGYRKAVLGAAEDVEDAFVALDAHRAVVLALTAAVESLERSRQAAQDAYTAGQFSLLEVIDADRQLLLTRDHLAQARTEAGRAAVAGYRALGGD